MDRHADEQFISDMLTGTRGQIERLCQACESPIERTMMLAILHELWPLSPSFANVRTSDTFPGFGAVGGQDIPCAIVNRRDRSHIVVYPQLEVVAGGAQYRLDIAIVVRGPAGFVPRNVAVECDGHNFHERTPEQASRDKARDRALQSSGWLVARFTGTDIVRAPAVQASEVAVMLGIAQRKRLPPPPPPGARALPPGRVLDRSALGVGAEVLAILAAYPALADVAVDEKVFAVFPDGPMAAVLRGVVDGSVSADALPGRLEGLLPPQWVMRVSDMLGAAKPPEDASEHALRKAILLSHLDSAEGEYDRWTSSLARGGAPTSPAVVERQLSMWRRTVDLKKRIAALDVEG